MGQHSTACQAVCSGDRKYPPLVQNIQHDNTCVFKVSKKYIQLQTAMHGGTCVGGGGGGAAVAGVLAVGNSPGGGGAPETFH